MIEGYITKGIGGFYYVKTADKIIECKPKGIFRKRKITPLAGDVVTLEEQAGAFVIDTIAPRKNFFIRPPVANVDVLFIIVSTVQPVPSTLVIDKLCAIAVDKSVKPVIVITKTDIENEAFIESCYDKSGITVIKANAQTGQGLDEIKALVKDNLCVFCGNSGVGKSTLINALMPQVEAQTGGISQKLGRGRHTTREVTLYEAFGGRLADTPGFASLEMEHASPIVKENLQFAFPEIEKLYGQCKFTGCAHTCEKGCAVIQAVEAGEINQTRYQSYLTMYNEAKEVKDWQR